MLTPRLLLLAALAGCGAADANSIPDRTPAIFERMLAEWDAMKPGADRDALAAKIDRAAAQRYATTSRLYWHTDLDTAKAAAKASGKPILSLRMLGRLDEDLSCANSRYFRIALYANARLSKFLRDRFVLHWSSERAVPKVTIDFGDGRTLERTITGNSAHYVLDADGRPVDLLPGLYAPAVFERELAASLALVASVRDKTGHDRDRAIADHHRKAHHARYEQWGKIAKVVVPARGDGFRPEAYAQLATVTKSGIEMPTYRVVDLGVKVGALPDDANAWAQLGLRLMPEVKDGKVPKLEPGGIVRIRGQYIGNPGEARELEPAPLPLVGEILDANSKALLAKLAPRTWGTKSGPADARAFERMIGRFERDILADTAVNEFDIRLRARSFFMDGDAARGFDHLNRIVYSVLFRTPKDDPWLGLAPEGITALPADGFVAKTD